MKVLIIEPDRNLCRAILTILELAGHEATCAHDGRAGLKQALEQTPSIVLCDTSLPHHDGYEVLRILRQSLPADRLPFVLMTVYLTSEDMAKGLALGATAFLVKPFSDSELLRKLETATS